MGSLEQKRALLEQIDVVELEISKRLRRNPLLWQSNNSHSILGGRKRPLKETILQQHEIKRFIEEYQTCCENLKGSLEAVKFEPDSSLRSFDSLYGQLKDFHNKYPDRPVDDLSSAYKMGSAVINSGETEEFVDSKGKKRRFRASLMSSIAADLNLSDIFSEEEYYGNYLDLIKFHQVWLNLPGNDLRLSYTEYLDVFNKLPYPTDIKLILDKASSKYIEYVTSLEEYMRNFFVKIHPLGKPQISINKIEQDFTFQWEKILKEQNQFSNNAKENHYQVKADGSVQCLVCNKEFAKFTVFKGHTYSKKHVKNYEIEYGSSDKPVISPISSEDVKIVERKEFIIREISLLLLRQISGTRTNVERKKLLTEHERFLEQETLKRMEEDEIFESSGESEDGNDEDELNDDATATYSNPLKLPLGVDGKPIPYWLFKLNGLGLEFSCEVCGNFVYQGRKTYTAHFGEAKHLNGLKCLGIDTSLIGVFKGISRIQDVLKLKEKLNVETKKTSTFIESIEEVEDEEGNVLSKRDYEDLKKQGLL